MAGSDTHGATIEKNIGPYEDVFDRISVGEQSESKPVKYFAIVEHKTSIKEIFYKIEVPFVLFYEVECSKGKTLKACLCKGILFVIIWAFSLKTEPALV